MRLATAVLLAAAFALPAAAQTTQHRAVGHTGRPGHPTATDKGPYTAEADKAYMGGGVILQSAPGGAPPPASAAVGLPANSPMVAMPR